MSSLTPQAAGAYSYVHSEENLLRNDHKYSVLPCPNGVNYTVVVTD